ncbi:hypothetical protein [Streptomyces prasinopilosus]|uniref:hypothetical protein n=1 Tax=Streptomyces prasinopilosus TaxID=67344 RepID=UPI0006EB6841|nr:hypothetical protein [Streptomyces prasinopilosus]
MSDELATALHELAEANQAPPPLPAAEVRTRARRRSRRRRTTVRLGLATSVAGMLATIGLTVHAEEPGRDPRAPAGSATIGTSTSSPRAPGAATGRPPGTEEAVLDLGRHTLTFDGRVMRVDPHPSGTLLSPGRELTVRAKHEVMLLRSDGRAGNRRGAEVPYVVELRTGDRPPVYAGALVPDTRSLGAPGARTGWLGLGIDDARWFYTRIRRGEHVEIVSPAAPATPAPGPDPADGPDPETGTATSRPPA